MCRPLKEKIAAIRDVKGREKDGGRQRPSSLSQPSYTKPPVRQLLFILHCVYRTQCMTVIINQSLDSVMRMELIADKSGEEISKVQRLLGDNSEGSV